MGAGGLKDMSGLGISRPHKFIKFENDHPSLEIFNTFFLQSLDKTFDFMELSVEMAIGSSQVFFVCFGPLALYT